ncbi:MAG: squalene synthase HpnC [Alphaproteobacteria bacterium]|nr:squalene synthase HpnC [Alphaproteobacteria bacterium]MBL6938438.1 squalene synthase HpnC [Alphaproteobacteria bacterium]MBL7096497.1 squalene synthase HpnC [Alphaproteobacteria bacterium]
MSNAADLASGKGHTDENFPVASVLIAKEHRPPVMAFYRFARIADDVSDSESASPDQKLALLEQMRASLTGESDASPEGVGLRKALAERNLTNQHGLDLLEAFRRDVTKLRYANWDELMDYCRYSAVPVGRFVLDVHGESRATWPANDALCAALQVINHLQDCAKDFRNLNRVYLPLDELSSHGLRVEVLTQPKSPPALRSLLRELARKNADLLEIARPFAGQIRDRRLSLEVSVIQTLADDLNRKLLARDPLADRVHHAKWEMPGLLARATAMFAFARLRPKKVPA